MSSKGIKIAIDRGGTFCDVIAKIPGEEDYVFKLLSVDPQNYNDAPTEGIRRVLEKAEGRSIPKEEKLRLESIHLIRMGTTVATNALLERKGAPVLLVTTKGFGDILEIGNQTRPDIFDLTAKKLGKLYSQVLEIDERVTVDSFSEGGGSKLPNKTGDNVLQGITGEPIRILKSPDYDAIRAQLQEIWDKGQIKLVALSLMHAYAFPDHEAKIADIARDIGFEILVSHQLQPMIGMLNRTLSTVADAYLTPVINEYLRGFGKGFEGGLEAFGNKLLFMQSNGGLCPWYKFTGLKAILLGPAGGMVGIGHTCYDHESALATIGFDAGGTSTDISRYLGSLEHIYETVVSEVALQTPQLDISTVAAGGGLMLFWKNGMFVVGPESAGLDPGPVCYRKGGPLTVTDANLLLGKLIPDHFPLIFGPNHDQPLDVELTKRKFNELTEEINRDKVGPKLTPEQVANGFLTVAVELMARPIRTITEAKGYSTNNHNLACFGGSGGQFSVPLAKNLGIAQVAVHKYLSLLSAYGILVADIVIERQAPVSIVYTKSNATISSKIEELLVDANKEFEAENLSGSKQTNILLNMRYEGLDTHLLINYDPAQDQAEAFVARHRQEFGFSLDRRVIVDDIQVLLVATEVEEEVKDPFAELRKNRQHLKLVAPTEWTKTYFDNAWHSTAVHKLHSLPKYTTIQGPAILLDDTQTLVVDPHASAIVLENHVLIEVESSKPPPLSLTEVDPIQLLVFGHRFMLIAEQMGKTLQQTAISTNIKERLDFSCALFDVNGDLVANAPHVPIHLGAMLFAVKAQMEMWKDKLEPGDVLVTNHPVAGGSHLPDITVITPVLDNNKRPVFWTALRGHHADIGLISAGSMPPNSKTIYDEGAAIVTHKLCVKGEFDEAGITRLLVDEPAKQPGGLGTRTLKDNISDLKAQVSANFKGISLLQALIEEYTYDVIALYMSEIQATAELLVRNLLKLAHKKFSGKPLEAIDYLDDGTPIALSINIDPETGSATFDFTNLGDEMYGNLNAPKAILYSAVLYVLRLLISEDIPLNNGCLRPITFLTRDCLVVLPLADAAVVGGNVETTQRIVDVMLKAFEAAAASQGTCNNFTFGINDGKVSFGYYETICGGLGAGPTWHGQSVVQCHTTNTRITDSEMFEKRYPVVLHEFSVRRGSGGDGKFHGGDGVIRDIEFTYDGLEVSCLMERRAMAPFGLLGGKDGARGRNIWKRRLPNDPEIWRQFNLGGKCTVKVSSGDRVIIMTPGGGGFGDVDGDDQPKFAINPLQPSRLTGSVAMRSMHQTTN
ncbi:hydantoinase B/oxoprolinase family protein [Kocuria palustris]|nr:hydantoinase B/oxoprolinase family protein [Kocuria palustris]